MNGKKGIVFIDEGDYKRRAQVWLKVCGNLRLTGDTGAGKTTLVHWLTQEEDWRLYEYSLTADTIRVDLLGGDVLKDGSTLTREGVVLLWLKDRTPGKKKVLYLDGFNYAAPNVASLLESLADFRGSIWVPELSQMVQRTPDHWIIISFNPFEKAGYSGTFQSNIATQRRFEGITVDYLTVQAETRLLMDLDVPLTVARRLVELANKTRHLYREGKLTLPLTTGNILNYGAAHAEGLDESDILAAAQNLYPEGERTTLARLWGLGGKDATEA